MNAKKEAWKALRSDYCGALGKQVTVAHKSIEQLGTSLGPPVHQPTSDDIKESLPNTETEWKPNKNGEPKSQETKKPMNTKSDADHQKNKIKKSEKICVES
ncbi:hypothetical protein WA026_015611 [Henosepilachna vigintioctopunctata]|uniref:Uncharacterized protein n=1 Tax=Henosepilachna vigintioctopunctata TaxID=420089 RepID=A0AAW1VD64_9CUCU